MVQLSKSSVPKRASVCRIGARRRSSKKQSSGQPEGALPLRLLLLYGSCRAGSLSRALVHEAAAVAQGSGAHVRIFEPGGLPLSGNDGDTNAELRQLHEFAAWADAFVWCSPEHHGALSGVMKLVLDCLPCEGGKPAHVQGKTVMLMQVSGGSHSSNAISDMQRIAASMGLHVSPKSVAIPQASQQFNEDGRLLNLRLKARLEEATRQFMSLALVHRLHADGRLEKCLVKVGQDDHSLAASSS